MSTVSGEPIGRTDVVGRSTGSTVDKYSRDGFAVASALPPAFARDLAQRVERDVDAMATEMDVTTNDYLAAVCRWSTPNPRVQAMLDDVLTYLRPLALEVLGRSVDVERASVFRKSSAASLGTHGHQDAGYWGRASSTRYDATTWVALDDVDETSGALRVVPGSHHEGASSPVDYLAPDFVDPADTWGPSAKTLVMRAGDAVTFDPHLWHASHGSMADRVRRALAVRWVLKDGNSASRPPLRQVEASERFGMYTSGAWLNRALAKLAGTTVPEGPDGVRWALDHDLSSGLPEPVKARSALVRLLVFWQASALHHATDQRGMVWDQIRDFIIAPAVGFGR